jgi:hypothetical protein
MKESPAMCRSRIAAIAAALAALLAAPPVRADDRPAAVAIVWQRGPAATACAGADQLAGAVRGQLRRNRLAPTAGADADAVIRGRTERRPGGGWRAVIRVTRPGGELLGRRQLTEPGPDCRRLDRALAVVLAMIVDSALVAPPPQPARDGERPRLRDRSAGPAPSWRFAIGIAVQGELGRLPGSPLGGALVGRIEPPAVWPVELSVDGWRRATADAGGGRAELDYRSASAQLCPLSWRPGAVGLEGCAGGQLGLIRARGAGFVDNRDRRELVVDGRADLRFELRPGRRWFARIALSGWLALSRPGFSYRAVDGSTVSLYDPAIVAAGGQIAVGARFP